jgi:tRNA pseudouridine13 synthase
MFVSAYQSYLFNAAISTRAREGPLNSPIIGDMLVFSDGKMDRVTQFHLAAADRQVERGRAVLALFIPGSKVEEWEWASPRVIELLEEKGIDHSHFRQAQDMVGASFQGFSRPVRLSTRISVTVQEKDVQLQFTLDPGQYATTVCREFMKNDPLCLV